MPIRINLLAEAQALEDMRRRDPVKRAILVSVLLVLVMLAYSSSLQLKAMIAKGELNRIESQLSARNAEFQSVLENQKKLTELNRRITALNQLANNRLLHGTVLNALQQTALPDVQLVRFRAEQSYVFNEEVKPKTNTNNKVTPGRPASVTERVLLAMEAKDTSANPGDQVNQFKQHITNAPYFLNVLGPTNEARLASLSPPQAGVDGKPFVLFTLECRYPERIR